MNSALERLLSLRVSDVMTRHVTTVAADQSLAAVAGVLREREISGAPVVDAAGKCVGLISATDFVKHVGPIDGNASGAGAEMPVREQMTSTVHSTTPDATLMEAARLMCQHHVHRVPVVDAQSHVVGVISSLDVAAALVQAFEE